MMDRSPSFSISSLQIGRNVTRFKSRPQFLRTTIELAKAFRTARVRCFDFWRLEDQEPYRNAMNDKLQNAAAKTGKQNVILVLENETSCNTATGAEAAQILRGVKSRWLMLNWDPGNAAGQGERPYPDGYTLLPKDRIGHCHCKDLMMKSKGADYEWVAMGRGIVDWLGQFKALKRDGYRNAVSLETHWRGAGTPEESTRQSWARNEAHIGKGGSALKCISHAAAGELRLQLRSR
jgi:L-ribulose-5-phosphate 3-epimerase